MFIRFQRSVQLFQDAEALIDGAVKFVITGAGVPDGFGVGVVGFGVGVAVGFGVGVAVGFVVGVAVGFGVGVAVGFGVGVLVGAGADILKVRDWLEK